MASQGTSYTPPAPNTQIWHKTAPYWAPYWAPYCASLTSRVIMLAVIRCCVQVSRCRPTMVSDGHGEEHAATDLH